MYRAIVPLLVSAFLVPAFAYAQAPEDGAATTCQKAQAGADVGKAETVQGGSEATEQAGTIKQIDKTTIDTVTVGADGKVKVVSKCGTPNQPGSVTMCFLNGLCVKCSKAVNGCNAASAQSQAAASAVNDPVAAGKTLAQALAQDAVKNPAAWQKISGGMESMLNKAYSDQSFGLASPPTEQVQLARSLDKVNTDALKAIADGQYEQLPQIADRAKSILSNPEAAKIFSDPAQVVRMLPENLQSKANDIITGFKGVLGYSSAGTPTASQNTFGQTTPSGSDAAPDTEAGATPRQTPPPGTPVQARVTFYAPGAGGTIEGLYETSRPNLEGEKNSAGNPIPRTLDDVRLGKYNYVTLASDPSNYGKTYNLGTLTYTSALDGKSYTLENVVGYVHDTGSAFQGRPDKFDVAVGDFRGWGASAGSKFVDSQTYGANTLKTWEQIGGVPGGATVVRQETGAATGFGSIVKAVTEGNLGSITSFGAGETGIAGLVSRFLGSGNPISSLLGMASNGFGSMLSGLSNLFGGGSAGSSVGSGNASAVAPQSPAAPAQPAPTTPQAPQPAATVTLLAQPKTVSVGGMVQLLWSSAGVRTDDACQLSDGTSILAEKNEGTKSIPVQAMQGAQQFVLACTPLGAPKGERSAKSIVSVTITP